MHAVIGNSPFIWHTCGSSSKYLSGLQRCPSLHSTESDSVHGSVLQVLQGFVNWRYKDMATSRIWILCLVVTMHNVCVTDAKTSGARITLTSKALNYGELLAIATSLYTCTCGSI